VRELRHERLGEHTKGKGERVDAPRETEKASEREMKFKA